jgi:predicted nucleotidyltransferase
MSAAQVLELVPVELVELCRKHRILRLAVFGSALSDRLRPDSDVDLLVEFEPGHVPGFAFVDVEDDLSRLFRRQVDLNTPHMLSPYFRERVIANARTLYAT